ncbi:MAG: KUP/HAK/KT family potassium transporter [Chitinophagales bacterium]
MSLIDRIGYYYRYWNPSPLYVLKAIIGDKPISEELVLGGISCIFWTLLIQTTTKYIFLTLKGRIITARGGIFSLYTGAQIWKVSAIPTIIGATTLLADGIITPPSV